MKILWIGCVESEEEFESKSRKGYNLASAQKSQVNIIRGIEDVTGLVIDSLNGSVLPPYPVYADKRILPNSWSHKVGAYDISVGYDNLKYLNRVNCKNSMVKAARNWVKERYQGDELVIFVYSMRSASMATACKIKKLVPKSKLYLIITDLPEFMDLGQNKVKTLLKKIDWLQIKKMQVQFDGFILYASKMSEYLCISKDKWILMEGSYDTAELPTISAKASKKKVIMYSGMIEKKYGINLLVDAFQNINNPNIELWITGGGNDVSYVEVATKKDKRIKFFGFLPSRNDVLAKQQEATVLINMRLPSEKASAYCFPSKLFEYMASGKPVLSFKLEGIPKEYEQYLITIENESVEGIVQGIYKALALSDEQILQLGKNGREFIVVNKNYITQCRRICSWINIIS